MLKSIKLGYLVHCAPPPTHTLVYLKIVGKSFFIGGGAGGCSRECYHYFINKLTIVTYFIGGVLNSRMDENIETGSDEDRSCKTKQEQENQVVHQKRLGGDSEISIL